MAWIKSDSSQILGIEGNNVVRRSEFSMLFSAPLLVLGECDYETMLVLRHNCCDVPSNYKERSRLLVKILLYQIIEQYPKIYDKRRPAFTAETASDLTTLWQTFLDCLDDVKVTCIFILIDNIDDMSQSDAKEGEILVQKLNALVQDRARLVKIILTARLVSDQPMPSGSQTALTKLHRKETNVTNSAYEDALVTHKLCEIQHRRLKSISFPDIYMLYRHNTTVYTVDDGELRAFIVQSWSWAGEAYSNANSQLELRAWSIDHNGKGFSKRFHTLTISQFSGRKAIKSLRYIPAGYLPNENEERSNMVARGRRWWGYSFGVHHVIVGGSKSQVRSRNTYTAVSSPREG